MTPAPTNASRAGTPKRRYAAAVGQHHDAEAGVDVAGGGRIAVDELSPEQPPLVERAKRQLGSADAPREAEVIADQRRGAGLPAERLVLHHRDVQTLRRGVHARGQAGRTGAHDGHVVHLSARAHRDTDRLGNLAVGGVREHSPVVEDDPRAAVTSPR